MQNPVNSTTQPLVEITDLSRSFKDKQALNQVSLTVEPGQVFGIVGENGAGKTTLIKHILGAYKAQQGQVKVFGEDPVKEPEKVLSQIGYLSEEPELPAWMSIAELLNYQSAFYTGWDQDFANELVAMFHLDANTKIKSLSKGQKARVGLILAQAHRPPLIVLDEPSSGLDPNARNDILMAIVQTIVQEGRTVIFSSHLLDEVERVCDHLFMLSHGHLLLADSMENVLSKHHRMTVKKSESTSRIQEIPGVINVKHYANESMFDFYGDIEFLKQEFHIEEFIEQRSMSLNDVFVARSQMDASH